MEKTAPPGPENGKSRTDEWMDRVEALAADNNPEDDERLMAAVAAIRAQERRQRDSIWG